MTQHEDVGRQARRFQPTRALTLTRRGVVSGALGIAGASAMSAGLVRLGSDLAAAQDEDMLGMSCLVGEALRPPVDKWSKNGLLSAVLTAMDDDSRELGAVGYAGGGVGFGGLIPGPTLRLFPGDRLRIRLE